MTRNVQGKCLICKRLFVRADVGHMSTDVCSSVCQQSQDERVAVMDAAEPEQAGPQCEASVISSGSSMAVELRCESRAVARASWTLGLHHSMRLCREHLDHVLDVCVPLGTRVDVQEVQGE